MKKQFLTLLAFAAGATAAYAQCGSATTRTWDGGGSDELFTTAANWSGDVLPDCNDNIAFTNSSSKSCEIPSSFTTTGNITVNEDYGGRITVTGTGTTITANNLTVNGTYFTFFPETGRHTFANNVSVGSNGMISCASRNGMSVAGTLTLNAGGFISFRTLSDVSLNALVLNEYGQFRSPERGTVSITGNFSKSKVSTFDHRLSTWTVNGTTNQTITGSAGGSGSNTSAGSVTFWNVVLNKTNTATNTSDNWGYVDNSDTIHILNRMTVTAGDMVSSTNENTGFTFHDTLDLRGTGAQGHLNTLRFAGNNTADLIVNDNLTGHNFSIKVQKSNSNSILNVWNGSGANSTLRIFSCDMDVEIGTIQFPDNMPVAFGDDRDFTIGANGVLTMPSTAGVSINSDNFNVYGSVIANQSTLEFIGADQVLARMSSAGGGRKAFYNISFSAADAGDGVYAGQNDTLESLNDVTFNEGIFRRSSGFSNTPAILWVNGDFTAASTLANNTAIANGHTIVLAGGNTTFTADARLYTGQILVAKNNASNTLTLESNMATLEFGFATLANSRITVETGTVNFPNMTSGIFGNTGATSTRGLVIGAMGKIVAPQTSTLTIRANCEFAGPGSLDPQSGTVTFGPDSKQHSFNGRAVYFNNLLFGSGSNNTWNSTDTLWVRGNLDFNTTATTFTNGNLVFEGNFTMTNGSVDINTIKAVGSNNQTITLASNTQIRDEGLSLDKSAGKVFAGSNISLNLLRLSGGLFNTNGFTCQVNGANSIFAGNSSSFIEGPITISSTTAWSGSRYFIPVGRGSNYRPVQLHASNLTNTFVVNYISSDTVTDLGTAGTHNIDAFSTSEYWIINRTGGGGASNAAFVELSTLGKDGSWNDADIRVARWNATNSVWQNYGPAGGASTNTVLASTSDWTSNGVRIFTIGVDNVPAPIAVSNEGISGNELDLVRNVENNSQVAAQPAISFNVFPNPVAGNLNIALSGADKGSITLSDLSGKVIGVYASDTRSIDMSRFAAGVYFATFSNGINKIAQRVVKY